MIYFPTLVLPYSTGVKLILKRVPSLLVGSSLPDLGKTVNSEAESWLNSATNSLACLGFELTNLNCTDDVTF